MESWKFLTIRALCWQHERPHGWHRIQHPDNPFRWPSDGHGMCAAYSEQLCDVCESLCHECGQGCPDSVFVACRIRQDWCSPEKLKPSTWLHFSGKWIISTIVFITDIVHQALAKITFFHAAVVYRWKASINCIYQLQTKLRTEICNIVPWLLPKDRLIGCINIHEVSSKVHSCVISVLTINLEVQVSICRDRNCGSYSLVILLWHMTNGNER